MLEDAGTGKTAPPRLEPPLLSHAWQPPLSASRVRVPPYDAGYTETGLPLELADHVDGSYEVSAQVAQSSALRAAGLVFFFRTGPYRGLHLLRATMEYFTWGYLYSGGAPAWVHGSSFLDLWNGADGRWREFPQGHILHCEPPADGGYGDLRSGTDTALASFHAEPGTLYACRVRSMLDLYASSGRPTYATGLIQVRVPAIVLTTFPF